MSELNKSSCEPPNYCGSGISRNGAIILGGAGLKWAHSKPRNWIGTRPENKHGFQLHLPAEGLRNW